MRQPRGTLALPRRRQAAAIRANAMHARARPARARLTLARSRLLFPLTSAYAGSGQLDHRLTTGSLDPGELALALAGTGAGRDGEFAAAQRSCGGA